MRNILQSFLLLTLLLVNTLAFAASGEPVSLQFLLVNDFHGHIRQDKDAPGAIKLVTTVDYLTKQDPQGTVLLAGGDMLSGTLDSNEFRGRPTIEMMNTMGFVADVAGNHAFDNDGKVIRQQANWAKFPFLAANIRDTKGAYAKPFVPSLLITRKGVKIGIVGLATMETPVKATKSNMVGFVFTDPAKEGNLAIKDLRKQGAQIIVLVAHMATIQAKDGTIHGDELLPLLEKLDNVDVVLSAHSHEIVAGTVKVHGRALPIVQAGWAGNNVAGVTGVYEPERKELTQVHTFIDDVAETTEGYYPKLKARLDGFLKAVDDKYRSTIATNMRPLANDRWDPYGSPCAEVMTDLMRKESGVQIAMYNGGGFRAGLPAGNVTMVNIMDIFPFNGTVFTADLKGSDLRKAVEHGLDNKKYGFLRFSGLKVKGRTDLPEGNRIIELKLSDGTDVKDDQTYRILTNDFLLSGGDDYTMLKNATNVVKKGLEVPFIKKAVETQKKIDYQSDDRLQIVGPALGSTVKHHA
jgi:5'-nucleotidase/UDP-sugar diphosphatase